MSITNFFSGPEIYVAAKDYVKAYTNDFPIKVYKRIFAKILNYIAEGIFNEFKETDDEQDYKITWKPSLAESSSLQTERTATKECCRRDPTNFGNPLGG